MCATDTNPLPEVEDRIGRFELHRSKNEWKRVQEQGLRCFHDKPKKLVEVQWAGLAARCLPQKEIDWICEDCRQEFLDLVDGGNGPVWESCSPPVISVEEVQ